jgi:hypothetical protein
LGEWKLVGVWTVEFTGVELAGGTELTTSVEKTAIGPVEKVAACLHTVQVQVQVRVPSRPS